MTQDNNLVSPTHPACPKPGSSNWSAFQTRPAGDTLTLGSAPVSGAPFGLWPNTLCFLLAHRGLSCPFPLRALCASVVKKVLISRGLQKFPAHPKIFFSAYSAYSSYSAVPKTYHLPLNP